MQRNLVSWTKYRFVASGEGLPDTWSERVKRKKTATLSVTVFFELGSCKLVQRLEIDNFTLLTLLSLHYFNSNWQNGFGGLQD